MSFFFAHVAQWWSTSLVRKRSSVQSRSWAPDFHYVASGFDRDFKCQRLEQWSLGVKTW
jgi:hypothetical protein